MIFTLIATGMREGEVFALHKDVIDFENSKLLVNKQFTKGKLKPIPKGHSGYRFVDINSKLLEALKKHINSLPKDCDLVFPNEKKHYYHAENIRNRVWKPLLVYSGIKTRVRIHDLRGSYIDMILSSGLSPKFAQNQVGHAKIQTTLDVYAQNNQDMIDKALKQLDQNFKM